MLLSLPLILFSWIGAQTFIPQRDKAIDIILFWASVGLLALSLLTVLNPNLATWNAIATGAGVMVYLTLWLYGKLSNRRS